MLDSAQASVGAVHAGEVLDTFGENGLDDNRATNYPISPAADNSPERVV